MTQNEGSSSRGPINVPRADIAEILARMPAMDTVKLPVIERRKPAVRACLDLTVDEPAGIVRRDYPVRWGVPFHRGVLPDSRNVRLLDESGREVPLQTKVTCFWPEGEVKWLVLEFLADVPAGGSAHYRLEYGTEITRHEPETFTVSREGDAVRISSASIALAMSRSSGNLVDRWTWNGRDLLAPGAGLRGFLRYSRSGVEHPEKLSGQEQALLDWKRTSPLPESYHALARVDDLEVIESGPVQVTVRCQGAYGDAALEMPFRVYLRVYANGCVHVTHTFVYNGYACRDYVRSYGLEVPLGLEAAAEATLGLTDGTVVRGPVEQSPQVAQCVHDRARVGPASDSRERACRTEGWIDVAGAGGGLTAAVQHAWQNFPVRLAARVSHGSPTIVLNLYGAVESDFLDLRYPQGGHQSHSFQGSAELTDNYSGSGWEQARGIGKTHVILLRPHDRSAGNELRLGPCVDRPLMAVVDPAYIADTCVFGHVAAYRQDPRFANSQRYFDLVLDYHIFMQQNAAIYGWVDYGDLYGAPFPVLGRTDPDPLAWRRLPVEGPYDERANEQGDMWIEPRLRRRPAVAEGCHFAALMDGAHGWATGEKGPSGFFMHFMMGGKRTYWDFFEHQLRHAMDIDCEHLGAERPVGFGMRHNQLHWRSGSEPRQTPAIGFFYHYWLTGEPRTFDRIEQFIRWVRPGWLNEHLIMTGACAGPGHYPLLLAWQTTGRKEYVHHLRLQARYHEESFRCGLSLPLNKDPFPVSEEHGWQGDWLQRARDMVPGLIQKSGCADYKYFQEYLDFRRTGQLQDLASPGRLPGGSAQYWQNYYYKDYFIEYVELTGDADVARMLLTIGYVSLASNELKDETAWGTTERMLTFLYQTTGDETFRNLLLTQRIERHAAPYFTGEPAADGRYEIADFLGRRGGFVAPFGHNMTICLTPHPREMAYAFAAFKRPEPLAPKQKAAQSLLQNL